MKTYLSIVRDHSGSMNSLQSPAMRDYNSTVIATQRAASANNIPTLVSTIRCGGSVVPELKLVPIGSVQPLGSYPCGGGTPLFESVNHAINDLLRVADVNNEEVTFIVMATTDGKDTSYDKNTGKRLAARIRELQNTDRWTFVFRVPRGYARDLIALGIPEGNVLEWDQTQRGVEAASQANDQAFTEFYANRAAGVKSTKTFYSSLKDVTPQEVAATLDDISGEVQLFPVSTKDDGKAIREYVESRLNGQPMAKGAAFYQLVKTEDKIQDYKLIAVRDRNSNAIFCGPEARAMLGLPNFGDARVRPGDHGGFDVFIQSTSVNRKVNAGTQLMYWPNVGVKFKEGKSAR